jgi:molybdenum cofactor biosynthesis enzyme MoaA
MSFIIVTDSCNQGCVYCSATERKPSNPKILERQIEQAKNNIILTGGEPTLNKDIIKIVTRLRNKGITDIELQTNGTMLSYPQLAKALIKAGVTLFNVALPSHLEKISDQITRTHGLFEKRIKGIKNLLEFGANVRITMIINTLNKDHILDYVKYVTRNFPGIQILELNFIKIMGRTHKRPWLVPKVSEIENKLMECCEFCKKNNINLLIDGVPLCHMKGYEEFSIDAIKFVTGRLKFFEEKDKIDKCSECSLTEICRGFRKGYKEIHGTDEFRPLKTSLERIREKILNR